MSAIFADMAHGGDDGGYRCLVPQRVLECSESDMEECSLEDIRKYIAETIRRALSKANKG